VLSIQCGLLKIAVESFILHTCNPCEAIAFASVAPEGRSSFPLGEKFANHLDGVFPQHFPAKDLEGFAIVSFKQWNDLS